LTIYSYLERFLFRSDDIRKKVGMLSGGERARVGLAKLLLETSNLLLLDEPTNDLDVTTLGSLEELLGEFGGSVIVVSHDRYFLNRVATDLLVFEGDGKVVHYVGNYDTYTSLRPSPADVAASATGAGSNAAPTPVAAKSTAGQKRPPKLTFKEEQELAAIEQRIEAAEALVSRLQAQLADPEFYRSDSARVEEVRSALDAGEREVASAMTRWEELETKRQAFESGR
jgi:ATP-binding cassette subfamily F protein uup